MFVDPPGQQWLGFTHSVDEIVVVLEGNVTMTVGGKTHVAAVGEESFIPAYAVHDLVTSFDAGSRYAKLCVIFSLERRDDINVLKLAFNVKLSITDPDKPKGGLISIVSGYQLCTITMVLFTPKSKANHLSYYSYWSKNVQAPFGSPMWIANTQ